MPRISGTVVRTDEIRNFHEVQAKGMLFFTFIATLMACFISFGVVYNNARITFSERSRELSSLRVLGYTRGEISYILLGELGLITLAAIPLGFLLGYWLCGYIAQALASDLFRVPLVIEPRTFSLAAAVVLASASVSALVVRRKLDRLDLGGGSENKGVTEIWGHVPEARRDRNVSPEHAGDKGHLAARCPHISPAKPARLQGLVDSCKFFRE